MNNPQMFSSLIIGIESLGADGASPRMLFQMHPSHVDGFLSRITEYFVAGLAGEVSVLVRLQMPFQQIERDVHGAANFTTEVIKVLAHMYY